MADIERRRELLERLVVVLGEFREARDIVLGALEVGDLGDDAVWLALLEMVLEEVVDDGANE
jgi:hypothetical protein